MPIWVRSRLLDQTWPAETGPFPSFASNVLIGRSSAIADIHTRRRPGRQYFGEQTLMRLGCRTVAISSGGGELRPKAEERRNIDRPIGLPRVLANRYGQRLLSKVYPKSQGVVAVEKSLEIESMRFAIVILQN